MNDIKDGGPAFPCDRIIYKTKDGSDAVISHGGMTLRDYFAAKAMQGIIQMPIGEPDYDEISVAHNAYKMADAMLKEREA